MGETLQSLSSLKIIGCPACIRTTFVNSLKKRINQIGKVIKYKKANIMIQLQFFVVRSTHYYGLCMPH